MNRVKGWFISKFFQFETKKLLSGILVVFLTILTVGTSIVGIQKVAGSFSAEKLRQSGASQKEVKGAFSIIDNGQMAGETVSNSPVSRNKSVDSSGVPKNSANSLQNNSSVLAAVTTPTSAPASSSGGGSCIVTLFGKQYNITNLLSSHSGGNVFACGTDMSASYQSRHGTNVGMMQGYLIAGNSSPGSTPTSTPNPTPTPVPNNNNPSTPTPTPIAGNCVITLFGNQYNITNLLSSHSGGNVFACGTDMSSSYQSRHGTNVSMMQSYLVSSGTTPTPTSTPVPTPTPTRVPTATPTPVLTPTPTPTRAPTPTPTRTPSGVPTPTPTRIPTAVPPTPTPTRTPTPIPTAIPTPTPVPAGCIVTLFGRRYDVASLRNTHSGPRGTFFVCGSDMSSTYQSRHGTNVSMMQRYLVP